MPSLPDAPKLSRRQYVFAESGGACTYCLGVMIYTDGSDSKQRAPLAPDEVTIEHLVPKSKGGSNALTNLAGCCVACNNSKADDMPADEYRAMRQRLLPVWPPCTFPPLSVRRKEKGLRAITKRFTSVFDDVSNGGYWRRWFGSLPDRKIALVHDRQKGWIAIKHRVLLEHLPGRATGREAVLWRFGPLRKIKLIKGRSAAYEDHDWLLDYGSFFPWLRSVDTTPQRG